MHTKEIIILRALVIRSPQYSIQPSLPSVHAFRRQMEHFLTEMSNRVEHPRLNQPSIEKWPFGFIFSVELGLRETQALIMTKKDNEKNSC